MAGYFVVLGDIKDEKQKIIKSAKEILTDMCHYGTYSTNLFVKEGVQKWSKQKVATFGDYYSMNEDAQHHRARCILLRIPNWCTIDG